MTISLGHTAQHPATMSSADTADDQALARLRAERQEFERRVRREVIAQHQRPDGWCANGTNRVLDDLGLPELQYTYTGHVTVNVKVTVRNATDLAQARSWVEDALTVTSGDSDVTLDDWWVGSTDDLDADEEDE
ncbi:hypothetical protein [Amycolatopsis anabasis]|uniref:hypothetical protein n=1 Tax=Amycolatopsis anabasis TaxID=1840409 RepID=UPI00131D0D79|nr:hypothetical protein [Amycolatopsis anabasis]